MLTGSMARNYYSQPRMTRDINVVVGLTPTDAEAVVRLFTPEHYISREAMSSAISNATLFSLIHQESIIKVDFIVRKNIPYRRGEFERRRRIEIEEFSTWIVSKEDLIISKLDWAKDSHSELQIRDVNNLAATGYDMDYVEHWTKALGLRDLWQEGLQ